MNNRTRNETTGVAGGNPTDWDALWRAAELPDADRGKWQEVMRYRTKLPEDAVILARHGWTPEEVVAAQTDPAGYWPDRSIDPLVSPRVERPESVTAALAVLASETALYHESRTGLARELRSQYILDLAERLPPETRWSHERVAQLLGLTRQRVRMIMKRKSM